MGTPYTPTTVTVDSKEYERLKSKATKWDKLGDEIADYYEDENGNPPKKNGDIGDIGEAAAMAFGWL